jgi:hypothetical protein
VVIIQAIDDWVALAKSDESLVLGVGDDLFYPPQIAHAIGGNLSVSPLRQPFLDAGGAASRTSWVIGEDGSGEATFTSAPDAASFPGGRRASRAPQDWPFSIRNSYSHWLTSAKSLL